MTAVQREMMVAWIRAVERDGYEIDLKGKSERLNRIWGSERKGGVKGNGGVMADC